MTRRIVLTIATLAVLAGLLALVASRWSATQARGATDTAAGAIAGSHLSLLTSELQKFRLLPLVLVEYPDVARGLDGDIAARDRLDRTLELLARRTDAAAIYAIDRTGRSVAASNWRLPTSFIGQDYGFRPYFQRAMRTGAAELFALGTVSGRPGLYLARRIDRAGRPLGVIVVKVEFDRVERGWARSPGATVVVDPHGVILVTSVPGWRFRTTHPLDANTLADARRTLQFGAAPPGAAPFQLTGREAHIGAGPAPDRYRVARLPAPLAGGELLHLAPLAPALAGARTEAALWALGLLLVLGVLAGIAIRAAETRRLQREARAALEEQVAHRTAELRDANAQLIVESEEREEAENRYRQAREDLAQANRLGTLGQIVAGVAHEINQPVAAIRTYAESGAHLLDRDQPAVAKDNLARIVGLTDRLGAITAELRAFARRKSPAVGATTLDEVVDGVGLLLGERLRGRVAFDIPTGLARMRVVGDRTRLEQILVNLLQNALEAIADRSDPRVTVSATHAAGGPIELRVADNGPGIAKALRDTLFAPFVSAKPDGLGLGLAIARDIARGFGGELSLERSNASGTVFRLALQPK